MPEDEHKKQSILIVEDESALLFALKAELSHSGYAVDAALSGEEAVSKATAAVPTVILLDLMLPGMSGFEVMERLRADEKTKDVPIIVISNLADTDTLNRAKSIGATEYIIKTQYSLERIVEKIKEVVSAV